MPIANIYARNAGQARSANSIPNIEKLLDRTPAGLSFSVIASFEAHRSETNPEYGVVGWSFSQNGLNYACCIRDDSYQDVYNFAVEVPQGQPYLHRAKSMSVAEKIHTLSTVQKLMGPDGVAGLRSPLYELEKACFQPTTGLVVPSATLSYRLLADRKVIVHAGLNFPENDHYASLPEPTVLALEWVQGRKRHLIDCSRHIPLFLTGVAHDQMQDMMFMTRTEALKATKFAKASLRDENPEMSRLCEFLALWRRLDNAADFLMERRSSRTYSLMTPSVP